MNKKLQAKKLSLKNDLPKEGEYKYIAFNDKDIHNNIEVDFTEKDWLIYSLFKTISAYKSYKPDELLLLQEIEEALHFFINYVASVVFTPIAGARTKFKYKIDFTETTEEEKEFVTKKIKEIIVSPTISRIIEKFIIEPKKKNLQIGISKKLTRYSMHSIKQFYGDTKQLKLFSDKIVDEFITDTGISLNNRPDSYGVVLNQTQSRVYEAIIKAFSDTNYTGHTNIDKDTYRLQEFGYINKIKSYNTIDKIPIIKITQAQLIELSGYDLKSQRHGDKVDVIEALDFLATKQFCFYWTRLKYDNKGKPIYKKNGEYEKEEVMEVGSIFRIKYVKDEKGGDLKYYEIHPSAAIIDQVSNYFLLIPNNWRDEVKQITGKKASKYTYEFLTWLRLQFELIRRNNDKAKKETKSKIKVKPKPFQISQSWDEIAIALKMPETLYKANKKRAANIIKEAYSVAIELGYLLKVDERGATDTLYLNEEFYPQPGALI